jgi:hypothetical protein
MKIKIRLNLLRESCASFSIGSVFREENLVKWVVKYVGPRNGHPYAMQGPRFQLCPRSTLHQHFQKLCAYNFLQLVTRALGWPLHLFSVTHASIAVDACWPNWWGAHTDT